MMKKIQLACLLVIHVIALATPTTPQVTITLVIDQLAFITLAKVKSYLKGGLKFLLHEGITYNQAYVPFACPETAASYTTLATGTVPRIHGVITNQHQSLTDTLSDQLVLQTEQHKHYQVFSIASEKTAALSTAHLMGKAFWFDPQTHTLTTEKPYYDTLPTWVHKFNQNKNRCKHPYTWRLCHSCMPHAYACARKVEYTGSCLTESLIGKTITYNSSTHEPHPKYSITPAANELVFDAALSCILEHFCKADCNQKLFLWIMPGALGKLAHTMGPDSVEVIDMIYHLDCQIKSFMDAVNKKTRKRNILWCLTSDHAVAPLPEQLQTQGYTDARRIDSTFLVEKLNKNIARMFGVKNLITAITCNNVYINQEAYVIIAKPTRKKIKQMIITMLESEPGISKVWTYSQLEKLPVPADALEQRYKNQLCKGRSGKFIICTQPYCMLTPHPRGAQTTSPYAYDTHVPLVIYQRGHHQRKKIEDPVATTQLAPTLAHILQVPQPSACTATVLPGIIFKEDCCF